jgi:hypothetical protein
MLIERQARAQERRVVPETIARFLSDAAVYAHLNVRPVAGVPHTFDLPNATPGVLRRYERDSGWRFGPVTSRYPRCSTDRKTADEDKLEWVTPGHPLFEAVRRHVLAEGQEPMQRGACFYSLLHSQPVRIDVMRARIVDGLGNVVHERVFAIELQENGNVKLQEPAVLGNFTPGAPLMPLPSLACTPTPEDWLHENVLQPFLEAVRNDRVAELERVAAHIQLSLTELLQKADESIGRFADALDRGEEGAKGLLAAAEARHGELLHRREVRKQEIEHQKALLLQGVEVLTSVLVFPHPQGDEPEFRNLRPDPEVEEAAMLAAMEYEQSQGRVVHDVHEKNLGCDLTSIDLNSGELRLIEVKGIGHGTGDVMLTPNEHRVAEDRRDCYWLYVVTDCKSEQPVFREPIRDPAQFQWQEITKVEHYRLATDHLWEGGQ